MGFAGASLGEVFPAHGARKFPRNAAFVSHMRVQMKLMLVFAATIVRAQENT